MKMSKKELQLIINILVKEHDAYFEMLMDDTYGHDKEEFDEEYTLRRFLLQAEKQGYKLNGLYLMSKRWN